MNGCGQIIVSSKDLPFRFFHRREKVVLYMEPANGRRPWPQALNAVPENKRPRGSTPDSKTVSNYSLLFFSDRDHSSHGLSNCSFFLWFAILR